MGYDETLFIKPLDSYWLCPICDDALQDAVETPCCEKIFCHSCLRDWIVSHQKNCPQCRTKLEIEQIGKRCKRANRYISEQMVKCPHKESHNCDWTGHVSDIDEHIAKSCQSCLVKCPFHELGCTAHLSRDELTSHLQEQMSHHLTLSLLKIGDMSREIETLNKRMECMNQISSLEKSVSHIRSEMLPIRNSTMALSGYLVFTIPRADFLSCKVNESIDSNPFEYGGYRWKIRVFPRGDRSDKEGYPSFYLWSEHNFEQYPKDIETKYTLSFENRNHQWDIVGQQRGGVLGATFTFTRNNGNGWSLKTISEELTTSHMADCSKGFIHEEDDCIHIRACILDVKPRTRVLSPMA